MMLVLEREHVFKEGRMACIKAFLQALRSISMMAVRLCVRLCARNPVIVGYAGHACLRYLVDI